MNNKTHSIITSILFLILFIGLFIYVYHIYTINIELDNINTYITQHTIFPHKKSVQLPKKDTDTSDWEIYTNEEYGFEVKYPQEWEWNDIDGISFFQKNCHKNEFDECNNIINVGTYSYDKSLENVDIRTWRSQCDNPKNVKLKNINQDVWSCLYHTPYNGLEYHFFDKNKNVFEINIRYNNDMDLQIMRTILQSFSLGD